MVSQKSSAPVAIPREPKRARGKARVEAILDAAAAVFAERGYDGATMVEIGERSNTAAGSLYRFFPTKELLANALLSWYAGLIGNELDAINKKASNLWPDDLADALVDMLIGMRADRAAAVALISARGDTAATREVLRTATRKQIMDVLMTTTEGKLTSERAEAMAIILVHILKSIPGFLQEPPRLRDLLIEEARALARLYLQNGLRGFIG